MPPGQGIVAPGSPAKNRATPASHAQEASAGRASQAAALPHTGAMSAASSPETVARGTGGAAIIFAGTAHNPTWGWSRMSSGAQASWAATGTAMSAAAQRGSRRDTAAMIGPEPSRIPLVAATDSAKP